MARGNSCGGLPLLARSRSRDAPSFGPFHPLSQKVKQGEFERTVGGELHVTNPAFLASALRFGAMGLEFSEIAFADGRGIDVELSTIFDVFENCGVRKV